MIRPALTELVLFLVPFAAYAFLLWAKNAGVFDPDSWPLRVVAGLTLTALALMAISAFLVVDFSGAAPGTTYIPAHIENGKLVPGTTR
jgi:hypothetical protein